MIKRVKGFYNKETFLVFWCKRKNQYVFEKLFTHCYIPNYGLHCKSCEDFEICEKKENLENLIDLSFQNLYTPFKKNNLIIYNEIGITEKVKIGRFTFKFGDKNGKLPIEIKK